MKCTKQKCTNSKCSLFNVSDNNVTEWSTWYVVITVHGIYICPLKHPGLWKGLAGKCYKHKKFTIYLSVANKEHDIAKWACDVFADNDKYFKIKIACIELKNAYKHDITLYTIVSVY